MPSRVSLCQIEFVWHRWVISLQLLRIALDHWWWQVNRVTALPLSTLPRSVNAQTLNWDYRIEISIYCFVRHNFNYIYICSVIFFISLNNILYFHEMKCYNWKKNSNKYSLLGLIYEKKIYSAFKFTTQESCERSLMAKSEELWTFHLTEDLREWIQAKHILIFLTLYSQWGF